MPFSAPGAFRLVFALLLIAPATTLFAQKTTLDDAVNAYHEADFDKAITLFADLAGDDANSKGVRKEALQFLGRSYIAKRNEGQAREAMEELIELEPPIVELDPDIEPPPLMKLYYDVRKEHTDS
jgi:hypothetical protein